MIPLDALDRKIIYQLDRDSRASYAEIGRAVRAKKETVKNRIEKLLENKVIEGFYTVIDYSKLGFESFRIYLTLEDISSEKREELLNYLLKNEKIWILYRTTGQYHFTFSIWVKDPWECEVFWTELIEKFGNYIDDHHLSLVTHYTEFSRNYLIENNKEGKKEFTILQKNEKEDLDKLDFKILNLLSTNARIPLVEIAKKLNTSTVTCRAHIKKLLQKKVIIGFRAMLNYDALDYQYYKVDLWFQNMEKIKEIKQSILSHPNVIYTEKTLATSHFEFDLEVKGFRNFIQIMDNLEKKFPDQIKKYNYYSLIKNYKINYLPSL